MHKLTASILILAFLAQTFSQSFYCVDYLINKTAYIKTCVNKSRPQMHCNGKCQLMKKMAEEEKKNQQQAPVMKQAKWELVSLENSLAGLQRFSTLILTNKFYLYNAGSPIDQPSSYFHPPSAPIYTNTLIALI